MSIKYSGTIRRSRGIVSAIAKQFKLVNLKAVNKVTVSFDPFAKNVRSTREFLFHLSTPKITNTNPNCTLKTEVICDRTPPSIQFSLIPAVYEQAKVKKIEFKSENLSVLELLQLCNKYISAIAPKEEVISVVKTKSEKKASAGKSTRRK